MIAEEFFLPVAEEIFCETLIKLGSVQRSSDPLRLRFESADWFVEIFALKSDGPRYSPRVEMGPIPEMGLLHREKQIDILFSLPIESSLRQYNLLWRYSNSDELKISFDRVLREIFIPFSIPLLSNKIVLIELVKNRNTEIELIWKNEIHKHNDKILREKANIELRKGNIEAFLKLIDEMPIDRLTDLEILKIKYLKNKITTQLR